jgi:hypothetical protein
MHTPLIVGSGIQVWQLLHAIGCQKRKYVDPSEGASIFSALRSMTLQVVSRCEPSTGEIAQEMDLRRSSLSSRLIAFFDATPWRKGLVIGTISPAEPRVDQIPPCDTSLVPPLTSRIITPLDGSITASRSDLHAPFRGNYDYPTNT